MQVEAEIIAKDLKFQQKCHVLAKTVRPRQVSARIMAKIESSWRPVAFKEWQLVSEALISGEQSVILRKGGISEGKAGFQWLHDRFFLYPSLFHEQVKQVKPAVGGGDRELGESLAPEGSVAFSVFVETLGTGRLSHWGEVEKLDPYHIWNIEIIRERFDWGDEPGISYAIVKAHSLSDPWILEDRKTFGGCRSWFGLPSDEAGGWKHRVEGADEIEAQCGLPDWLI